MNERYRIERITRSGLKVARYIALEGRGAGDREWCYSKAIFLIDDFCNKKLYSWLQKYGQFQLNKNKRESKNSNSQLATKFWIKSQIFNFPHLSWSEMFAQYFCCLQVCIRLNIICTFLWLLGSQQTKVLAISISIIVHGHPFLFRDGVGYFQYCKQNSQICGAKSKNGFLIAVFHILEENTNRFQSSKFIESLRENTLAVILFSSDRLETMRAAHKSEWDGAKRKKRGWCWHQRLLRGLL